MPASAAVLLALLPSVLLPYRLEQVQKIAISALFALSLQLLIAGAGLVSLGHAAFLGRAYVAVLGGRELEAPAAAALATLAVLAAAGYALFVGALSLRTRGVYSSWSHWRSRRRPNRLTRHVLGGGSDGVFLYTKPVLRLAGTTFVDSTIRAHLYYTVLGALVGTCAPLAQIGHSRYGHALAGVRANKQRMRAAGFPTYGYKLAAFVVAGALAGLARWPAGCWR